MIFSRIEATKPVWISAPLSVIGGLLVAGAVFWLFGTLFHKLKARANLASATWSAIAPLLLRRFPRMRGRDCLCAGRQPLHGARAQR